MSKEEIKDQFVIAYLTNLDKYKDIVNNAIVFANMLNKGLILLHISDSQYTSVTTWEAEIKLKEINNQIKNISFHSYCALKGKTKDIIYNIPKILSGVLLVSAFDNNFSEQDSNKLNPRSEKLNPYSEKILLQNLYHSRIAYFLFDNNNSKNISFNNCSLTLNHMRESKEKILWASYLGRFAKCKINIIHHNYKDEFFQKQLRFNIQFAQKILDSFNLNYTIKESKDNKTFIDYQAIEISALQNIDLIICQTTKNKNIFNKLFGLKEHKLLINKENIPILFVNPREDLFILCE